MELLQCSMERSDSVEESQLHSMLELHRIIGFLEIRGIVDDDRNSAMALRRTLLVRQRFIPVTPRPCAYMKPFLAMDSFLASSRNDYISNSPLLSLIVISIEARKNLMIPWKLGSICSFHGISNHQTSPTSNFHGNGVLCFTPVKEYNYSVESDFFVNF